MSSSDAASRFTYPSTQDGRAKPTNDPLRLCIFTTICIIAWVIGPPVALIAFSATGLVAYGRAWREGLKRSRCVLRHPGLVMIYLGLAFAAGLAGAVMRFT